MWETASNKFDGIDIADAARRLEGVVVRTPLEPLPVDDARIDLRGKMENLQVTGSFKARGAWNQVSRLTAEQRAAGVVCPSSGNHGKAVAWAGERAGIPATIVMPKTSYPNKIEACRDYGAEVVLTESREAADEECRRRVASGVTLIHPYDAERTLQGAGTVGLEIATQWPEVDVVIFPVGGGGLISGGSLALRRALGSRVRILGAEPAGSPSMKRGLDAGRPVMLPAITTNVQGLCPLYSGWINIEICRETVDDVVLLEDRQILEAQERLVLGEGSIAARREVRGRTETIRSGIGPSAENPDATWPRAARMIEPAGAAAAAVAFSGLIPPAWLEGRDPGNPLRVAVVVSGGNPDPAQIEAILGGAGADGRSS